MDDDRWRDEAVRTLQSQTEGLRVRMGYVEQQVRDLQRVLDDLSSKLDGLKLWTIGALIALIANLLLFIVSNLGKIFGLAAPVAR